MKVLSDLKIPLLNLILATLLGGLLRYLPVSTLEGINYKFVLHAHSHVAFLGWVYLAFFIGIIQTYFTGNEGNVKKYTIQFWLTQVSVIGMLITFPIQGYAFFSISFSTMHILLSYWFAYSVFKDFKRSPQLTIKHPNSILFIKAALLLLIFSSIGPWSLGAIMAKGLATHPIYMLSIYFYLYFQYNGWFTFAALGLFLSLLEKNEINIDQRKTRLFFWLLLLAGIPGFALYTLWVEPPVIIHWIANISSIVQVAGVLLFLVIIKKSEVHKLKGRLAKYLLIISLTCFTLKFLMQLGGVFLPIFQIRNFIIGYLHLIVIGVISVFILGFALLKNMLAQNKPVKLALTFILAGFVMSETIIFLQGFFSLAKKGLLPYYDGLLFTASILMPIGFIILLFFQFKKSHT